MVPVTHQVNTNTGYQGTKEVITPNTSMLTLLAQIATLLPNLSSGNRNIRRQEVELLPC